MNPIGLVFLAIGGFALSAAFSDWGWFWNNYRARLVTRLISKTGARGFYCLIGAMLLLTGVLTLFQVIEKPPRR